MIQSNERYLNYEGAGGQELTHDLTSLTRCGTCLFAETYIETLVNSLKIILLVALVQFPAIERCLAAEIRTVGNVEVDLQPLIDWTAKKKGERPLKHWKLVQILEQKKQSAAPELLCEIEGLKMSIILKNGPGEILNLLHQKDALGTKLAAARKVEATTAENLANAKTKRQKRLATQNHKVATDSEKAINKDLAVLEKKINQQPKIFAMFTGATFDSLPVWDTGLKSH